MTPENCSQRKKWNKYTVFGMSFINDGKEDYVYSRIFKKWNHHGLCHPSE